MNLRRMREYQLGREHYDTGISDFYRRTLEGDARSAYMLGRSEAASQPLLDRIRRKR